MGFFDRFSAFVDPKESNEPEEYYEDGYDEVDDEAEYYDEQPQQRSSNRSGIFSGFGSSGFGVNRRDEDPVMESFDAGMRISLLRPTRFDEAQSIASYLLDDKAVVFDLQGCDVDTAINIVNFVSGATFALNGSIQKINENGAIFVAVPPSVSMDNELRTGFEMDDYGPEISEWVNRTHTRDEFID